MLQSKTDRASENTRIVQSLVGDTLERLNHGFEGRVLIGYGVYTEPGHRRDDLVLAIGYLQQALNLVRMTNWPSVADYEESAQGE